MGFLDSNKKVNIGKLSLTRKQVFNICVIIVALIAISLIAVFTYLSRAIGRKAAGAAEKLSTQEGESAKAAVEDISEDSIKDLGED